MQVSIALGCGQQLYPDVGLTMWEPVCTASVKICLKPKFDKWTGEKL